MTHNSIATALGFIISRFEHARVTTSTRSTIFWCDEKITVLDTPAEYPHYGESYYAVFFADPDGMKLELVHYPWGYWRKAQTEGHDPRPRYEIKQ